jgi:hypothetical protein
MAFFFRCHFITFSVINCGYIGFILYRNSSSIGYKSVNFIFFCYRSFVENTGPDRVNAVRPANPNLMPTPQATAPPQPQKSIAPPNNRRPTPVTHVKRHEYVNRATSPVDERIINEFYTDQPKDVHQYKLEGRQYVVYEGANFTDIETYQKGKEQRF